MFNSIKTLLKTILITYMLTLAITSKVSAQELNNFSGLPFSFIQNDLDEDFFNDQTEERTEGEIDFKDNIIRKEYINKNKLEKFYSKKSNEDLKLQGYEFFINNYRFFKEKNSSILGVPQDDYILNIGDEITLVLQGGRNETFKKRIQKDGFLYLDFTDPILAFGKTLGTLKKEIKISTQTGLTETNIYISIGKTQKLTVTVTGEVNFPGTYSLPPFSNPIDALLKAGGIKKSGTLRNIKISENGSTMIVDLYDFFFGTNKNNLFRRLIQNNAIINVPPIGKTVVASGSFSKNGIYELVENTSSINDLIEIAGGFSTPGEFSLIRKSISRNNKTKSGSINKGQKLNNGDIIFSFSKTRDFGSTIELIGSVNNPGVYPHSEFQSLSSLIKNEDFINNNTYSLSIIIERTNQNNFRKDYIIKNLNKFFNNQETIDLKANDKVYFFNRDDLKFLSSNTMKNVFEMNLDSKTCNTLVEFQNSVAIDINSSANKYYFIKKYFNSLNYNPSSLDTNNEALIDFTLSNSLFDQENNKEDENKVDINETCFLLPEIFRDNLNLLIEVYNNVKLVKGSVKFPGLYLYNSKEGLNSLLDFVGASTYEFLISPDKRVIDVGKETIKLEGHVKYPSEVEYSKGLSIRNILKSSSYFLDDVYPFFGIVLRKEKNSGVLNIIPFNPSLVVAGILDFDLIEKDYIRIFNSNEINEVNNVNVIQEANLSLKKSLNEMPLLNELGSALNQDKDQIKKYYVDNEDNKNINNDNVSDQTQDFLSQGIIPKDIIDIIPDNFENIVTEALSESESLNNNQLNSTTNFSDNISLVLDKSLKEISDYKCGIFGQWLLNKKSLCKRLFDIFSKSTVTLNGAVNSPGIYLVGNYVPKNELIKYAGGYTHDSDSSIVEISNLEKFSENQNKNLIFPGGSIYVNSKNSKKMDIVLSGSFEQERSISFRKNIRLSNVLKSLNEIKIKTYLFFGTVERNDEINKEPRLIPFSPYDVINKNQDLLLSPGDKIKLYTNVEVDELIATYSDLKFTQTPQLSFDNLTNMPLIKGDLEELIKSLSIRLEGSVINPGQIIVASMISLDKIFEISGGLSNEADIKFIEIITPKKDSFGNYVLNSSLVSLSDLDVEKFKVYPGSLVRVSKVQNDMSLGFVEISGSVNQPGKYRILKDDDIFEILKRSGGLQDNAYLKGLVFTRLEEKKREEKSLKRLVGELEKAVLVALENQSSSNRVSISDINALRQLILKANKFEPLGRVVGNFDNIDKIKSTRIKDGDKIFIPSKQNSVTIIGEVMSPGSIMWDSKRNLNSYIEIAAGFTDLAESKNIFIIGPNGQASRKSGLWSPKNKIFPGSTIVVPRRIKLSSSLDKIEAITSVIYQLTVTLAGIDNLLND